MRISNIFFYLSFFFPFKRNENIFVGPRKYRGAGLCLLYLVAERPWLMGWKSSANHQLGAHSDPQGLCGGGRGRGSCFSVTSGVQ